VAAFALSRYFHFAAPARPTTNPKVSPDKSTEIHFQDAAARIEYVRTIKNDFFDARAAPPQDAKDALFSVFPGT
jgi:hypothetical protein